MRVLGVLAAWGVLAVLATLCFAVGGSIGYRRGVQDAVRQLRERRSGKTGCRPLPLPHHRRRPITRIHASPARSAHAKAAAPPAIHRLRAHLARPNLSPALAGAMAAVFLFALPGVALGASAAQPGDNLWPVKRGIEQVRLAMATSPDGDMQIHVDLASRRVNELNQLLTSADADPELVDTVIDDLREHTEAASERLHEVDPTQRQQVAERVEAVVHRQVMAIDVLLDIDCTDTAQDDTCVALGDTRAVADQLHQATVTVAMAGDDAVTGTQPAAAGGAEGGQQPSEADMVASTESPSGAPGTAAAGTQPTEAGSEAASEAASEGSEAPSTPPSTGTSPPSTPPDMTAGGGAEEPATGAAAAAKPAGDGETVTSSAEEATEAAP